MTWEPGPTPEPERGPDVEPAHQPPGEPPDQLPGEPSDQLPGEPPDQLPGEPPDQPPGFAGPAADEEPARRGRRLVGSLLALVLVASVALAGWIVIGHSTGRAGDSGVASAGGTRSAAAKHSQSPQDQAELARKFNQCMKDQGIDTQLNVASGGDEGGPVTIQQSAGPGHGPPADPKKVDEAMQKCKQYLPNGGEPPKVSPEDLEKMRRYARCMRDNGVPGFPDPQADGGIRIEHSAGADSGNGSVNTSGLDPNDPAFKQAEDKCKQYQPTPAAAGGH